MANYPPKSRTKYLGYSWKLCPYSAEYKSEYYDNDLPGPSNHNDLRHNPSWSALVTAEHPTTSGTMVYKYSGVPGWICLDTNCYYYTNVHPGGYFFES